MKISYAIPFCGEWVEIKNLLSTLIPNIDEEDEIVILVDSTKVSTNDISTSGLVSVSDKIKIEFAEFKGNFADWKNLLNSYCTGDYIYQIDADECPTEAFLKIFKTILKDNPDVELFRVPRENRVEGLTQEDILQWGWRVTDDGLVNWPDYQWRIYKNRKDIKWEGIVHEKPTGFKTYVHLPANHLFALSHNKSIEKQRKQNNYYNTLS